MINIGEILNQSEGGRALLSMSSRRRIKAHRRALRFRRFEASARVGLRFSKACATRIKRKP